MELTVDQALQQGVAANKEGKVQDAERLYRAIVLFEQASGYALDCKGGGAD